MPATRTFRLIVVDEQHGTGLGDEAEPAKEVQYTGKSLTVKL
jgi:alpha-D-xyloside xylohydrolase